MDKLQKLSSPKGNIPSPELHITSHLTIRDGRHAKHRQNGRVVFYAMWVVFILYV